MLQLLTWKTKGCFQKRKTKPYYWSCDSLIYEEKREILSWWKSKKKKRELWKCGLEIATGRCRVEEAEEALCCVSVSFLLDSAAEQWVRNRLYIVSWLVGRWCWLSTRSSPETSLPLQLSVFTSFPLPTTSSLTTVTTTPSIFWLRMVMVMSPPNRLILCFYQMTCFLWTKDESGFWIASFYMLDLVLRWMSL